jgi:hypothetical protein
MTIADEPSTIVAVVSTISFVTVTIVDEAMQITGAINQIVSVPLTVCNDPLQICSRPMTIVVVPSGRAMGAEYFVSFTTQSACAPCDKADKPNHIVLWMNSNHRRFAVILDRRRPFARQAETAPVLSPPFRRFPNAG